MQLHSNLCERGSQNTNWPTPSRDHWQKICKKTAEKENSHLHWYTASCGIEHKPWCTLCWHNCCQPWHPDSLSDYNLDGNLLALYKLSCTMWTCCTIRNNFMWWSMIVSWPPLHRFCPEILIISRELGSPGKPISTPTSLPDPSSTFADRWRRRRHVEFCVCQEILTISGPGAQADRAIKPVAPPTCWVLHLPRDPYNFPCTLRQTKPSNQRYHISCYRHLHSQSRWFSGPEINLLIIDIFAFCPGILAILTTWFLKGINW